MPAALLAKISVLHFLENMEIIRFTLKIIFSKKKYILKIIRTPERCENISFIASKE